MRPRSSSANGARPRSRSKAHRPPRLRASIAGRSEGGRPHRVTPPPALDGDRSPRRTSQCRSIPHRCRDGRRCSLAPHFPVLCVANGSTFAPASRHCQTVYGIYQSSCKSIYVHEFMAVFRASDRDIHRDPARSVPHMSGFHDEPKLPQTEHYLPFTHKTAALTALRQ